MKKKTAKYDISKLKKEWERSVGGASGISFEVALLFADNPGDLASILSFGEGSMKALASVKSQYEKGKRLIEFAKKFRKVTPGRGGLSESQIDELRKSTGSSPPNARGVIEHFPKTPTHNQFNYKEQNPLGVWNGRGGRKPLPPLEYPPVLYDPVFAQAQKEDIERQRRDMARAEMSFHATRGNRNWDDYLTGRTGDWSGYDPSAGPLGDIVRGDVRRERMDRARGFARSEVERYESEDLEKQRRERADSLRDSRLHDSRNSIAVRRRQLDAYRKYPWVKTLVDSGVIQKKNLPKIAKSLTRIEKTPLFGKFIKHPIATPALLALGLGSQLMNESSKANKKVTSWADAINLYGTPTKEFSLAAKKAGISDKAEQAKLWGKLSMTFGDPNLVKGIGSELSSQDYRIRMGFANKYGLDPTEMAFLDIFSGSERGKKLAKNEARRVESTEKKLQVIQDEGFASGSGVGPTVRSTLLWLPLVKGALSRAIENMTTYDAKPMRPVSEMADEAAEILGVHKRRQAIRSAESLDRYNDGSLSVGGDVSGNTSTNKMAVYINNFNAQTNNVDQLQQELVDAARGHDRLGVAEAMDTGIKR